MITVFAFLLLHFYIRACGEANSKYEYLRKQYCSALESRAKFFARVKETRVMKRTPQECMNVSPRQALVHENFCSIFWRMSGEISNSSIVWIRYLTRARKTAHNASARIARRIATALFILYENAASQMLVTLANVY